MNLSELLSPPDSFDARPAVAALVSMALDERASDLHLRPLEGRVEVLIRRDGVLSPRLDIALEAYARLLVGLKNLARLASYKKSVPQDGRMQIEGAEVRVAIAPTHYGEKVVLRFLRSDRRSLDLGQLGLSAREVEGLQRMVDRPQGLVLATGPAGSGKTTTLFAALRWRYAAHLGRQGAHLNVVTLEDPVETAIPEFTQCPIHPERGMTFATGLRSILRQDPEVILVGEIRDPETATAAVQCSLSGHLVLSTLHARDSLGVVPRLLEMGAEAYLLSASMEGVLYQRLVRRLCLACRREVSAEGLLVEERRQVGLPPEAPCWEAVGCPQCLGTGYRGRAAVPELLEVDEELRQGILDRAPLRVLRQRARLHPLRQAALERVAWGLTSYAEVQRVVP